MQGLNLLLTRYSQLLVLRVMHRADHPLSGREIERQTGLSNRAAMQALDNLLAIHAVHCEVTPSAHAYVLNRDNYFVNKALQPAFEAEDAFWTDFRKWVRRMVLPRPLAVVATGPLARDEVPTHWRLPLVMVFKSGHQRIRAFRGMDDLQAAALQRYAITLEPILLDVNSMHDPQHDALWRRVEREGILLFGTLP